MQFLLSLLFITGIVYGVEAYTITLDPYAEECFFEKVEKDSKLGLSFEVAESGFSDIDLVVSGPDDKIIYQKERESSGKYTFHADIAGRYTYCFKNQKSSLALKIIMFNMEVSEPPKPADDDSEGNENEADVVDHKKLDEMIGELHEGLREVKNEQEYMTVRNRVHRSINESTNFRVVIWSFFEATALVSMTMGQIFYLKRFFEIRRVV